jgi:hypothetical protein
MSARISNSFCWISKHAIVSDAAKFRVNVREGRDQKITVCVNYGTGCIKRCMKPDVYYLVPYNIE